MDLANAYQAPSAAHILARIGMVVIILPVLYLADVFHVRWN